MFFFEVDAVIKIASSYQCIDRKLNTWELKQKQNYTAQSFYEARKLIL